MPIRLNRADFLQHLESVQPGLSPADIVDQSSCFVFRDGKVLTYNDEVACQIKSMLPSTMEGAVQAGKLLTILAKYKEENVSIRMTKSRFYVRGKSRETWVARDGTILLETENVDKPKKGSWLPLHEDFTTAVNLVKDCCGREEDAFALTCIHIHPEWIEASDNDQMIRYHLETGVEESVCIKRDALKHIVPLGMTEFSVGKTWVHFRNSIGLQVSCRRWMEEYPNWTDYFKVKGVKTSLPKGLTEACEKAGLFSSENEKDLVNVRISPGKVTIEADGVSGGHKDWKKLDYNGPKINFFMSPKLLSEIVQRYNHCTLSKTAILVKGGKWKFAASMEFPNEPAESIDGPDDGGAEEGD